MFLLQNSMTRCIDQMGDFHTVLASSRERAAGSFSAMDENGLTIINTFALGPVWVQDGAAADIRDTITA